MNASFATNSMHKVQSTVKRSKTQKGKEMKKGNYFDVVMNIVEKDREHADSTQKTGTIKWLLVKNCTIFRIISFDLFTRKQIQRLLQKKPAIIRAAVQTWHENMSDVVDSVGAEHDGMQFSSIKSNFVVWKPNVAVNKCSKLDLFDAFEHSARTDASVCGVWKIPF